MHKPLISASGGRRVARLVSRLPKPVKAVGTRFLYLRTWGKVHHLATRPAQTWDFLLRNREVGNFTYGVHNEADLPGFVGAALEGHPSAPSLDELRAYLAELAQDAELHGWLTTRLGRHDLSNRALFGRRAGWYILMRALKPTVVLETGTDVGMGSALLARAMQRNYADGGPKAHLWTFDFNDDAGWAIPDSLRPWVTLVPGDLRKTLDAALAGLPGPIDLMIHDSDHTYEHEMFEFTTVGPHLARDGVLLTDNGHVTTVLQDYSNAQGRQYSFWREVPEGHPYPGAGIGLSVAAKV